MDGPSGKRVLSDEVRASNEPEVVIVESDPETEVSGNGRKFTQSNSLETNHKHDTSTNRVVEVQPRNEGCDHMRLIRMAGRVLNRKYTEDDDEEEMEDGNNSKNRSRRNHPGNVHSWQGEIGSSTSRNGIGINRTTNDKDLDNVRGGNLVDRRNAWQGAIGGPTFGNRADVKRTMMDKKSENLINDANSWQGATGAQSSKRLAPFNEIVPFGKSETKEMNNARADVAIQRGRGERYVTDLVWGKVRSHPWWPGQIFSPSAASEKAKKYFKSDCQLVAYFGDKTFAWNKVSKIKPFRMHFSQMEEQSDAFGFCNAVSCALEEVGRRVEFGLSCQCLPHEVLDGIEYQIVSNAGIKEESSKILGGDSSSGPASFVPGELVKFLESLAENPLLKTDRLQFTIAKSQLLAFNRWKGRYELPVLDEYHGLLEDDTRFTLEGEGEFSPSFEVPSRKRKSTGPDGSSWKCKQLSALMSCTSNSSMKRQERLFSASPIGVGNSQSAEMVIADTSSPDVILSKLIVAAKNPLQEQSNMTPVVDLLLDLRKSTCSENAKVEDRKGKGKEPAILEGTEDTYWTDRIIQYGSQGRAVEVGADKKGKDIIVVDSDSEGDKVPAEDFATALVLNFTHPGAIPSVARLNEIFRRYGPLIESETRVLSEREQAVVIFKRRADAETASRDPGKYKFFGLSFRGYAIRDWVNVKTTERP